MYQYRKVSAKFHAKILIFKIPVIFGKLKSVYRYQLLKTKKGIHIVEHFMPIRVSLR